MVHPVLVQTFYYSLVMLLGVVAVSALLRGFFWKYCKVRMSFGKYVLIKIRTTLRDFYTTGWVDEGWLIYKVKSEKQKYTVRLAIPKEKNPFYRCLAVTCVDVDDEKNAIVTPDFSVVTGFDARALEDLHVRALMRPTVNSGQEKLVLVLLFATVILALASAYLSYKNGGAIHAVQTSIATMKGTIIGTASTI